MRYVCKNPPGGGTKPLSAHRLIQSVRGGRIDIWTKWSQCGAFLRWCHKKKILLWLFSFGHLINRRVVRYLNRGVPSSGYLYNYAKKKKITNDILYLKHV